ncbi:MAG: hypothetical protein R2722_08280 [Tessaracoccus sp.]
MFITEAELRDQLRRPRFGAEIVIPAEARLTASANDFVTQWRLVRVEPRQRATAEHLSDVPSEDRAEPDSELQRLLTEACRVTEEVEKAARESVSLPGADVLETLNWLSRSYYFLQLRLEVEIGDV